MHPVRADPIDVHEKQAAPLSGPSWRTYIPQFVTGALAGMIVAYLIHQHHTFIFSDDHGYDVGGVQLASDWRSHIWASPRAVAGGSASYGYYLYVGAIYYVFGHHPMIVCCLNAALTAMSAIFAGMLGVQLGGPRLGQRAAWFVALYPTALFWGGTELKDGPLEMVFLGVLVVAVAPLTFKGLLAAGSLIGLALLMRPVLGVVLIAAVLPAVVQALVRRFRPDRERHHPFQVVLGLIAGIVIVGVIGRPVLAFIASHLQASVAAEQTTIVGIPLSAPSGYSLVHSLLSPLPWTFKPGSIFGIYPGMVIWILILPAGALGAMEILRNGNARTRGALFAVCLYFGLYLLAGYSDIGFSRQRFAIEPFFLILALLAFQDRQYWAELLTAAWAVVLGIAALAMGTGYVEVGVGVSAFLVALWWLLRRGSHSGRLPRPRLYLAGRMDMR